MRVVKQRANFRVEIMADSIVRQMLNGNEQVFRLITVLADFPRIILAEVNTHRLLSRNSASSRAIPIEKMIEQVMSNPFIPLRFPKTHKGMQADEWVEGGTQEYNWLVAEWLLARDEAVRRVTRLNELGISKQLANRILEPFLMHRAILSATEWENLFALRAHGDAQYEFQVLAYLILEAINDSVSKELQPGEWHLPFGDKLEYHRLQALALRAGVPDLSTEYSDKADEFARMVTVARCARVSYRTFEGKDDYEADVAMFNRLAGSGHWSPFEHVARAMSPEESQMYSHTYPDHIEYGWCGNFRGFIQLRKTFPRDVENRPEPRIKALQL